MKLVRLRKLVNWPPTKPNIWLIQNILIDDLSKFWGLFCFLKFLFRKLIINVFGGYSPDLFRLERIQGFQIFWCMGRTLLKPFFALFRAYD
jgi:hypothetical protein